MNADAFDDLLVGEGAEELAGDDLGCDRRIGAEVAEDDVGGEDESYAGGDDEGEEDL